MARSLTASGPKPTAWQRALDEFIIEGVKTTIPMHKKILADEDFKQGNISTKFMERYYNPNK